MSIKKIAAEDLRRMNGKEGLILQGCGGDPQEWLDGINGLLTENKLLLDGTKFENIYVFEHEGFTNILFPFDGSAKLDMGRLAVWRLQTHDAFGGTWLSDYVPNRLGGFEKGFYDKINEIINDEGSLNIYTSPDFQCNQTGGFPTSLCVCWSKGKAWLKLNENILADRDEMELDYYRDLCADFGIRNCFDTEDFNNLLKELGEDAYATAHIPEENADEGMVM